MYLATVLGYPALLALLCLGAGLLADRASGGFLPAALLPCVGAAVLIAVSQLTTYAYPIARATPYLMGATGLAGLVLGRVRLGELARRSRGWLIALPVLAFGVALAPVLASARASFSSYQTLADSAVHMLGAAFLLTHGQHYVHLDLHNSYGLYVNGYYNTSYPSGSDTLYGGSALLVGLPLIWAFQPFNAFMLAIAAGPAWLIARRTGLRGAWAVVAALSAVLAAIVYAYDLFGSIKEISSLSMILALGCLVIIHRRWLAVGSARAALPFALVSAAGVSALGVAFGVWVLAACLALAVPLARELARGARSMLSLGALVCVAAAALVLAALPTWADLSGSLSVANGIASTSNPGNLQRPLRAAQVLGVWLGGSYKLAPVGAELTATQVLIGLSLLAAAIGAVGLLRRRAFALSAWLALMLLAWAIVAHSVTTWGAAKTLMLTAPVVVLLAWSGVASVLRMRPRALALPCAATLALCLAGGVLVSDAQQYHFSNLAPTARYEELASLDSRFKGEGPTLFTDFDEYSLYALRDLDVGGPDFRYPPPAAAGAAHGHATRVRLQRLAPRALLGYPLIITRRDPAADRPPAAYRLVWEGTYYQVWRRARRARSGIALAALSGSAKARCVQVERLAARARPHAATLVAARAPQLVGIPLRRASHPRGWGHESGGLVMSTDGPFRAAFKLPHGGRWELWVLGQVMPTVRVSVDGRTVRLISGQLDGNSLVPEIVPPITISLAAGAHTMTLVRESDVLAPGDGRAPVLDSIFLTPASAPHGGSLVQVPSARWRSLCSASYEWVELV